MTTSHLYAITNTAARHGWDIDRPATGILTLAKEGEEFTVATGADGAPTSITYTDVSAGGTPEPFSGIINLIKALSGARVLLAPPVDGPFIIDVRPALSGMVRDINEARAARSRAQDDCRPAYVIAVHDATIEALMGACGRLLLSLRGDADASTADCVEAARVHLRATGRG